MNILLTGATGYLGNQLVLKLSKIPAYRLYAITRNNYNFPEGIISIVDDDDLEDNILAAKPDMVIHLASYLTSSSEPTDMYKLIDSNITFGARLLNILKGMLVQYFINVGSFSEYHYSDGSLNPTYLYAATKTAFRSILKYYSELRSFKVINVIPYTIYGGVGRQNKIMDILFNALDAPEPIKMSSGLQKLDFIHLNDVVDFFVHLINSINILSKNEVLHLGTGKCYNLREVSTIIETITGKKINADWGTISPRERDTLYARASVEKLNNILNWLPKISLETGLTLKYKNIQNGHN